MNLLFLTRKARMAVSNPLGTGGTGTTNWTKAAWIAYLQGKYGTVGALNTAWGSSYSAWGTAGDGGYGTGGTTVYDEDDRSGHNSWMGSDPLKHAGANANAAVDFDEFTRRFVVQDVGSIVAAFRTIDSNHLIFCPDFVGESFTASIDPHVMTGYHDAGCNAINVAYGATLDSGGDTTYFIKSAYDASGLPVVVWETVTAQVDSEWYTGCAPSGGAWGQGSGFTSTCWEVAPLGYNRDQATQALRGTKYAADELAIFNAQGTDGTYPVIDMNWWAGTDDRTGEHTNYGLVTLLDNLYNGNEAIIRTGVDAWGYASGGEPQDFGNSADAIAASNLSFPGNFAGSTPNGTKFYGAKF
jgi:hypothetical protein